MAAVVNATDVWTERRRRTAELRTRRGFVRQLLDFYGALLPLQEKAFLDAASASPSATQLAGYVSEVVAPGVIDVSLAAGPDPLRSAVLRWLEGESPHGAVDRWIKGEEQPMIERFLARASLGPVLEALGPDIASTCGGSRDAHHCPHCGGPPQLSYFAAAGEDLATGLRYLMCARCHASWGYPRMTCAACGEDSSAKLTIFNEEGTSSGERGSVVRGLPAAAQTPAVTAVFPHIRVEACESCKRYLLSIDVAGDPLAVPVVDELTAVPLDLYARERGYSKITPNLMGF